MGGGGEGGYRVVGSQGSEAAPPLRESVDPGRLVLTLLSAACPSLQAALGGPQHDDRPTASAREVLPATPRYGRARHPLPVFPSRPDGVWAPVLPQGSPSTYPSPGPVGFQGSGGSVPVPIFPQCKPGTFRQKDFHSA